MSVAAAKAIVFSKDTAKWLLALAPLLFYGNIYFGLRWLDKGLIEVFMHPVGLALLLLMSATFVSRAFKRRIFPLRMIFFALGLLLLGVSLSLMTRQSESIILREGESGRIGGKPITLTSVSTLDYPSFLLTRDQVAKVKIGSRQKRFGVLPTREGMTFFHTTRFGFSPNIRVIQENNQPGPWLELPFGPDAIDEKYNKLVPRRPPPRLMLGVGMYPPELETLFLGKGDKVYFLRLEEGSFGGRPRDLMDPDYFLWLTDGRVTDPVYRLMVWRGEKQIFNRRMVPNQPAVIDEETIEIGALQYWVEISRVTDYGLPLVLTAWMILGTGLALIPLWMIGHRLSRRRE